MRVRIQQTVWSEEYFGGIPCKCVSVKDESTYPPRMLPHRLEKQEQITQVLSHRMSGGRRKSKLHRVLPHTHQAREGKTCYFDLPLAHMQRGEREAHCLGCP